MQREAMAILASFPGSTLQFVFRTASDKSWGVGLGTRLWQYCVDEKCPFYETQTNTLTTFNNVPWCW